MDLFSISLVQDSLGRSAQVVAELLEILLYISGSLSLLLQLRSDILQILPQIVIQSMILDLLGWFVPRSIHSRSSIVKYFACRYYIFLLFSVKGDSPDFALIVVCCCSQNVVHSVAVLPALDLKDSVETPDVFQHMAIKIVISFFICSSSSRLSDYQKGL